MNFRQGAVALAEQTREEYIKPPYRNLKALYGLVSDNGIEYIKQFGDMSETEQSMKFLSLRARFNTSRNLRTFVCLIKQEYIPDLDIDRNKHLYEQLKERSVVWKTNYG